MNNRKVYLRINAASIKLANLVHDILPGGKADAMKDSQFNKKKLKDGKNHEMEHTTNPAIAKELSKDHMAEDPNYYKKLNKVDKLASLLKLSTIRTNAGHESEADVNMPAMEDVAFLSSKPSSTSINNTGADPKINKSKARKAFIRATEKTLGVDPSVKEGSWSPVLHKLLELGLN